MDVLKRIDEFGEYEDDWNGYGARKFTAKLLECAREIAVLLPEQFEVFPVARNSVQFEYEYDDGDYLEFEVFEDRISAFRYFDGKVLLDRDVSAREMAEMAKVFVCNP